MKKITFFLVLLTVTICIASISNAVTYTITRLTYNNTINAWPIINDEGFIVWKVWDGNDYEVALYNPFTQTITYLTDNDYSENVAQINVKGDIIWSGFDGSDNEIFLFDSISQAVIQITDNNYNDYHPRMNNGGDIVWYGDVLEPNIGEIFHYDQTTSTITQLTHSVPNGMKLNSGVQINEDNYIVWHRRTGPFDYNYEIYLYDPTTQNINQLNGSGIRDPKINNNNQITWLKYDDVEKEWELVLYDIPTELSIQLTHNNQHDYYQQMNDIGYITWEGWEDSSPKDVWLYNGDHTLKLTTNYVNQDAQINNKGHVVWIGIDGSESEIFFYNGSTVSQITENDYSDGPPQLNNNGYIVWAGQIEYNNSAIFLAIPNLDSDGDGIPDDDDICPDEDATGFDADEDGCIDSFSGLIDVLDTLVNEGVIETQMRNSLIRKIENAWASADRENICAAVNQLEAFKNQVNAQRGHKISDEAADLLIAYVDNLIAQLLSELAPGDTC